MNYIPGPNDEEIVSPADRMSSAVYELIHANEQLVECQRITSAAYSSECAALNRVNKAQAEIDLLVRLMRKNTPSGTDWYKLTKGQS